MCSHIVCYNSNTHQIHLKMVFHFGNFNLIANFNIIYEKMV